MPSRFFGYIEGYYGRMLSWEERSHFIGSLQSLSLNAYLYAPKEDPYHRKEWRTPYPREWIAAFSSFVKQGRSAGISVIPGVAPGLSFDYCRPDDYAELLRKCSDLARTGVRTLCLLMDDIPASLPESCRKAFSSLGTAHGSLLARLLADLKNAAYPVDLWFCPTVYADELVKNDRLSSHYLHDLAATIPHRVLVLWTGTHVISKTITSRCLGPVSRLFNGNVCIWDNIYANDYCPRRLFIGPYQNRGDLRKTTRGVLLNPTGLAHTDRFLLSLLSGYARGVGPETAWKSAVEALPVAKELKVVAPFFSLPHSTLPAHALKPRNIERVRAALKTLIWDWKSPLQREWYAYLYSLDSDIALLECAAGPKRRAWIQKKFPPVLADILYKR